LAHTQTDRINVDIGRSIPRPRRRRTARRIGGFQPSWRRLRTPVDRIPMGRRRRLPPPMRGPIPATWPWP